MFGIFQAIRSVMNTITVVTSSIEDVALVGKAHSAKYLQDTMQENQQSRDALMHQVLESSAKLTPTKE